MGNPSMSPPGLLRKEHGEDMRPSGETGTRLSGDCSKKVAVELRSEKSPDVMQDHGGSSRGLAESDTLVTAWP